MNTKLSAVSDKRMDLMCSACGHKFSYKIADLILANSEDATTHEVRQRAVCRGCGVRGDAHIRLCSSPCMSFYVSLNPIARITTSLRD